jgi:hypothetical protein
MLVRLALQIAIHAQALLIVPLAKQIFLYLLAHVLRAIHHA